MTPYTNDRPMKAEWVDRAQRDELVEIIRRFLGDELTAFALDETLDDYRHSADPTVQFVAMTLWYHYDDCIDHVVTLNKLEWDYVQRLLLVLKSDHHIVVTPVRRWSWTQAVAIGCLIGFGWCIWHFGWGQHLLAFSIPFGVVSIAISNARCRYLWPRPKDQLLTPFPSLGRLRETHRGMRGFAKSPYPRAIAKRRIRSRVAEFGMRLQLYAAWVLFSPVPLLYQALPLSETQIEVQ